MQNECLLAYCRTRSIGCYSIIAAHEAINSRICLSCSQKAAKHLVIAMKIMELSHRFREINAVGTTSRMAWMCGCQGRIASERSTLLALLAVHHPRPRLERRIASETPTLLAQRRHAGAVRAHHVASLPKYQRARGGIRDQGHRINSYANTRMPATDRVSCVRETTYGEVPLKTK